MCGIEFNLSPKSIEVCEKMKINLTDRPMKREIKREKSDGTQFGVIVAHFVTFC